MAFLTSLSATQWEARRPLETKHQLHFTEGRPRLRHLETLTTVAEMVSLSSWPGPPATGQGRPWTSVSQPVLGGCPLATGRVGTGQQTWRHRRCF